MYSLMEELKSEIRRTDHLCYHLPFLYISRFYDQLPLRKVFTKKSLSSSNYLSKGHYKGTASFAIRVMTQELIG